MLSVARERVVWQRTGVCAPTGVRVRRAAWWATPRARRRRRDPAAGRQCAAGNRDATWRPGLGLAWFDAGFRRSAFAISAAPTTRRHGTRCRRSPSARNANTPDAIWLTEHPPIYTLGLAGRREHLLRDNGIPVLKVDRGGQVTYHGPGQLVVYTLFDLRRSRGSASATWSGGIESAVIEWLDSMGISAYGKAIGARAST